jgi:hypothetical protein
MGNDIEFSLFNTDVRADLGKFGFILDVIFIQPPVVCLELLTAGLDEVVVNLSRYRHRKPCTHRCMALSAKNCLPSFEMVCRRECLAA